ncbi:hypothetical protein V6Z11_D08G138800 [Gossypium hirsutum]
MDNSWKDSHILPAIFTSLERLYSSTCKFFGPYEKKHH